MPTRDLSPIPRSVPYTYVTWLSRVISGESQCHYAGWFKTHFTFAKVARDANLDAWAAAHTLMVHDAACDLKDGGYQVFLEEQNLVRVRGKGGAVLAGKPDIVAIKGDTALVVECKTGEPRTRDTLQTRLYLHLLGEWSTHPARGCGRILGEVRYDPEQADAVHLPHAAADGMAELVRRYMRVFLSPEPPVPVPSFRECRYCDLSKHLCPDRVEGEVQETETNLF